MTKFSDAIKRTLDQQFWLGWDQLVREHIGTKWGQTSVRTLWQTLIETDRPKMGMLTHYGSLGLHLEYVGQLKRNHLSLQSPGRVLGHGYCRSGNY
jgi:hypothetical protein